MHYGGSTGEGLRTLPCPMVSLAMGNGLPLQVSHRCFRSAEVGRARRRVFRGVTARQEILDR
jgi:ribosomal protein S6E (S10)